MKRCDSDSVPHSWRSLSYLTFDASQAAAAGLGLAEALAVAATVLP